MKYDTKAQAILLRKQGLSYGDIRSQLGVSKSTLSGWLSTVALSATQIASMKQKAGVVRAEKVREIKRQKKQIRQTAVFKKVGLDIERGDAQFVAGFYLYWGEGTKTAPYTVSLTNSDSALVHCFVQWLGKLGVSTTEMRVKLHVYSDQNEERLKKFWSEKTGIPLRNFNKSYIKSSKVLNKSYKGMFGNGTCVVAYHNRDVYEYVLQGIEYLREKHSL